MRPSSPAVLALALSALAAHPLFANLELTWPPPLEFSLFAAGYQPRTSGLDLRPDFHVSLGGGAGAGAAFTAYWNRTLSTRFTVSEFKPGIELSGSGATARSGGEIELVPLTAMVQLRAHQFVRVVPYAEAGLTYLLLPTSTVKPALADAGVASLRRPDHIALVTGGRAQDRPDRPLGRRPRRHLPPLHPVDLHRLRHRPGDEGRVDRRPLAGGRRRALLPLLRGVVSLGGRTRSRKDFRMPKLARALLPAVLLVLPLSAALPALAQGPATTGAAAPWYFALSGDSRDCGDLIMPKIARAIADDRAAPAAFYWHLGDFRRMFGPDCDVVKRARPDWDCKNRPEEQLGWDEMNRYLDLAWDDFIARQIEPFAPTPVFLGIGNHELGAGRSRADIRRRFQRWLTA